MDYHRQGHGPVLFLEADYLPWGAPVTAKDVLDELRAREAILRAHILNSHDVRERERLSCAADTLLTIILDLKEMIGGKP
jgi:hypothetical protein